MSFFNDIDNLSLSLSFYILYIYWGQILWTSVTVYVSWQLLLPVTCSDTLTQLFKVQDFLKP